MSPLVWGKLLGACVRYSSSELKLKVRDFLSSSCVSYCSAMQRRGSMSASEFARLHGINTVTDGASLWTRRRNATTGNRR